MCTVILSPLFFSLQIFFFSVLFILSYNEQVLPKTSLCGKESVTLPSCSLGFLFLCVMLRQEPQAKQQLLFVSFDCVKKHGEAPLCVNQKVFVRSGKFL